MIKLDQAPDVEAVTFLVGRQTTAQKDMKIHIGGTVEREIKNEKVDAGVDK